LLFIFICDGNYRNNFTIIHTIVHSCTIRWLISFAQYDISRIIYMHASVCSLSLPSILPATLMRVALINFKHVDTRWGMFGRMQTSAGPSRKNFGRVQTFALWRLLPRPWNFARPPPHLDYPLSHASVVSQRFFFFQNVPCALTQSTQRGI